MRLSLVAPYATRERILEDLKLNGQQLRVARYRRACLQPVRIYHRGRRSPGTLLGPPSQTHPALGRVAIGAQAGQHASPNEPVADGECLKTDTNDTDQGDDKMNPERQSPGSHPLPREGRVRLHESAFGGTWWEHCTVRGWADGSTVYKFNQLDPGKSDKSPVSVEGVTWTTALKLGVKFAHHYYRSIKKLQHFVTEWDPVKGISAKYDLKHSQYKSWAKAARQCGLMQQGGEQSEVSEQERLTTKSKSDDSTETTSSSGSDEEPLYSEDEGVVAAGVDNVIQIDVQNDVESVVPELSTPHTVDAAILNNSVNDSQSSDSTDPKIKSNECALPEPLNLPGVVEGSNSLLVEDDDKVDRSLEISGKIPNEDAMPATAAHSNWSQIIVTRFFALFFDWMKRVMAMTFISFLTAILKLYRMLPYVFRSIFQSSWPPRLEVCHASETVAHLLENGNQMSKITLADAGFDSRGRYINADDVLIDVPTWKLEQLVRTGIQNPSLYRTALTHATAITPEVRSQSFERLEYLGDAVMELCIREVLMERSPQADEGELTMQAQALVAGTSINNYALWLGLERWVVRNIYAMRDGLAASPHVFGDAFEALLGAVYLDRGLDAAKTLLMNVLDQCPSVEWVQPGESLDYKGQLWRARHLSKQSPPVYLVNAAQSRACGHNGYRRKYWVVEVFLDGEIKGKGGGFEKKEAEQRAAQAALQAIS